MSERKRSRTRRTVLHIMQDLEAEAKKLASEQKVNRKERREFIYGNGDDKVVIPGALVEEVMIPRDVPKELERRVFLAECPPEYFLKFGSENPQLDEKMLSICKTVHNEEWLKGKQFILFSKKWAKVVARWTVEEIRRSTSNPLACNKVNAKIKNAKFERERRRSIQAIRQTRWLREAAQRKAEQEALKYGK